MLRIILGGLVGGVILFGWQFVSHMMLTWHTANVHEFQDENAVMKVLLDNADAHGNYMLPGHPDLEGVPEEDREALMAGHFERWEKGPCAFVVLQRDGTGSFARKLTLQFVLNVLAAAIATWFLSIAPAPRLWQRLLQIEGLALFALLLGAVPNSLWYGFSENAAMVVIADTLLMWFLAGLVLSMWFAPRSPAGLERAASLPLRSS